MHPQFFFVKFRKGIITYTLLNLNKSSQVNGRNVVIIFPSFFLKSYCKIFIKSTPQIFVCLCIHIYMYI